MKENQIEYQQFLINGWENKEESVQYGENKEYQCQNSKALHRQNTLSDNKLLLLKEDKGKKIERSIHNSSMPKIINKKQSQHISNNLKIVKPSLKLFYPHEGNHLQPLPYQMNHQNSFSVKIFHKDHKLHGEQQIDKGKFFRTRTEGLQRYNLFSGHHSKIKNNDTSLKRGDVRESLFKNIHKCSLIENVSPIFFKQKKMKMHSTNTEAKLQISWKKSNSLPFAYRQAIQKYYKQARPKLSKHLYPNNNSKHTIQQQFQRYSAFQSRS